MKFNPDIHHRKSIRLPEYDYSRSGFYFITICVHERLPLFGSVVDGQMYLNDAGAMVEKWWGKIPEQFPCFLLNEYIIMPNHIHGIVQIAGTDPRVSRGGHVRAPLYRAIQWFKTMSTNEYLRCIKDKGWCGFNGRLWQRNYYERIIRNEIELLKVCEYVRNNPMQWNLDEMHVL